LFANSPPSFLLPTNILPLLLVSILGTGTHQLIFSGVAWYVLRRVTESV
jgi:uncharacterized paraquat-inducible protein A